MEFITIFNKYGDSLFLRKDIIKYFDVKISYNNEAFLVINGDEALKLNLLNVSNIIDYITENRGDREIFSNSIAETAIKGIILAFFKNDVDLIDLTKTSRLNETIMDSVERLLANY